MSNTNNINKIDLNSNNKVNLSNNNETSIGDNNNQNNIETATATTSTITQDLLLLDNTKKSEKREIETLTDICCSDNLAEVDLFSLINENIPLYKLRADTLFTHNNSDWIEAPLYIDEQDISELTNEQIKYTLDYFLLSGFRVSQMTKTYRDVDAVNKLLEEKEKDLELAATIGKQLLDKGQELENRIQQLEEELEKASDLVNQLRYEMIQKEGLLQKFYDLEDESLNNTLNVNSDDGNANKNSASQALNTSYLKNTENLSFLNGKNTQLKDVETLRSRIKRLENDNYLLRSDTAMLKEETDNLECQEQILVNNCVKELANANSRIETIEEELKTKNKECSQQQDDITQLYEQIMELHHKLKDLTLENVELKSVLTISAKSQNEIANELVDMKNRYNECLELLHTTQDELRTLRQKYTKKIELKAIKSQRRNLYSPWMGANSFAAELHFDHNREQALNVYKQKSESMELVRRVREKLIKSIPGSNIDSCLPSDSEYDSMLTSSNSFSFQPSHTNENSDYSSNNATNTAMTKTCFTPDSYVSVGSRNSFLYSTSNGATNIRSYLPDKLQIVKPIEGSQTLQQWQQLATPNLGCLVEPRPGIYIKGKDPNCTSSSSGSSNSSVSSLSSSPTKNEPAKVLPLSFSPINGNEDTVDRPSENVLYENLEYDDDDDVADEVDDIFNANQKFYQSTLNLKTPSTYTYIDSNLSHSAFNPLVTKNTIPTSMPTCDDTSNKFSFNKADVDLLTRLLESKADECGVDEKNQANLKQINEIKNLTQKFYTAPLNSDAIKIDKFKSFNIVEKIKDMNLLSNLNGKEKAPATPPPSPSVLDGYDDDELADECLLNHSMSSISIATPPGTPTHQTEPVHENMFSLNQIISKLLPFKLTGNDTQPGIVKPKPIYPNGSIFNATNAKADAKDQLPNTPPSSPLQCASPVPSCLNLTFNENDDRDERLKNSAFLKVSTLNPMLNKSVDLATLLSSLSSLRRSQHLNALNT